jgi:hypothetical protein
LTGKISKDGDGTSDPHPPITRLIFELVRRVRGCNPLDAGAYHSLEFMLAILRKGRASA